MTKQLFAVADRNLFIRAKQLRKQQTGAEEILWTYLRQKPQGFKFRRQHPFGIYILDFYCHPLKLAIEVDGNIHEQAAVKEADLQREKTLDKMGLKLLRFTNQQVLTDLTAVIQSIETKLLHLKHDASK